LVILTAIVSICLVSNYFLNKKRDKILLIGLDGASWRLIMPLINEGKTSRYKNLLEKPVRSHAEGEIIKERMRSLGYIN
jgi:hypothetical protein